MLAVLGASLGLGCLPYTHGMPLFTHGKYPPSTFHPRSDRLRGIVFYAKMCYIVGWLIDRCHLATSSRQRRRNNVWR